MQFQSPVTSRSPNELLAEEYTSLVEQFLAALDAQPVTKRTYRRSLRQLFLYLEHRKITRPRREDILAFKQWLRDGGKSACYLSNLLTATRKFFLFLASEHIYPDIAQGIRGTKPAWGLRDPLSIADTQKLLVSIDRSTLLGKRDYALINLMVRTGPRTIELRRSNIEDIRTVSGEHVLYLQGKGEESKSAFVVLTAATYQPLIDYLRSRGPMRPSDPIFSSLSDADIYRPDYRRISTRQISRIAKQLFRTKLGINSPRVTAHSTRSTAICLALLGGSTVQETMDLSRHRDVNQVLRYSASLRRTQRTAPEYKVDALLAKEEKEAS